MTGDGTYTIPDVEILRVGRWNGRDYALRDLDDIVEAHEQLKAEGFLVPRVTLDHSEQRTRTQGDGGPSLGFVDAVRRVGDRLVATLVKVPAMLANAIKRGNYGPRSVEVWWDIGIGGREYPAVLTALSFLGADLPAVDGLADIERLYEEPSPAFLAALSDPLSGAQRHVAVMSSAALSRQEPEMDPEILQALGLEDGASAEAIAAKVKELVAKAEAVVKPEPEQEPAPEPEADVVEAAGEVVEAAALRRENASLLARVAKLESDRAKEQATQQVDGLIREGRLMPAGREHWVAHLSRHPESFAALSSGLPKSPLMTELGHSGGTEADPYALTADEKAAAKKAGVTEEEMYHQKLRRAGQPIPAKKEG